MDHMLFASFIFYLHFINPINPITILKDDSKREVTGIPLHESRLPQKVIDQMC